jgi:hypothetical protein
MVVEVLVTGHLGRDVIGGFGVVFTLIARKRKIVEIIRAGNLLDLMIKLVGPGETRVLAGNHGVSGASARDLASTVPDSRISLGAIGVHVNPILARLLQRKCQVRRIYFDDVTIIKVAQSHNDRPLRQLQLQRVVIQIEKCNAGFRVDTDCGRTYMQLGS